MQWLNTPTLEIGQTEPMAKKNLANSSILAIISSGVFLSSCASQQNFTYVKAGGDLSSYSADWEACTSFSHESAGPSPEPNPRVSLPAYDYDEPERPPNNAFTQDEMIQMQAPGMAMQNLGAQIDDVADQMGYQRRIAVYFDQCMARRGYAKVRTGD